MEDGVLIESGSITFDPSGGYIVVRLNTGSSVSYSLSIKSGPDLLKQIRDLNLSPLDDDDRREIYEMRIRLPRPRAFG